MKRAIIALVAALAAFFIPAAAFAGVDPYAESAQVNVDDSTPTAGQTVTVTLSGFGAGETVRVVVTPGGIVLTVTADASGSASVQFTAPATAGSYTVTGTGLTTSRTDSVTLVVSTAGGGGVLPDTGSESSRLLRLGGVAAAFGAGLVGVSMVRRRQRQSVSV